MMLIGNSNKLARLRLKENFLERYNLRLVVVRRWGVRLVLHVNRKRRLVTAARHLFDELGRRFGRQVTFLTDSRRCLEPILDRFIRRLVDVRLLHLGYESDRQT